ncbi:MAG: triose-phosphate isomerase [Chloroflexota bacterium]|nr:triose-phosphate isomerase [Chloroflexota bacterium]
MRRRVVIGNWKMNPPTIAESVGLAQAVIALGEVEGVEIGIAPGAVAIADVAGVAHGTHVAVYAQDLSAEEKGAFTGQISAAMLKSHAIGSIVGHSEVRRDLGDTDERVAKKLARALSSGLRVVLCVGETEAQFLAGHTERTVAQQVSTAVAPLRAARERAVDLIIAYEPIWAIGTGRPATAAHASAAAAVIRRSLETAGLSADVPLLYGGSVTAAGASEFAQSDGIDGALVGGASLKAEEFASIVRAFA